MATHHIGRRYQFAMQKQHQAEQYVAERNRNAEIAMRRMREALINTESEADQLRDFACRLQQEVSENLISQAQYESRQPATNMWNNLVLPGRNALAVGAQLGSAAGAAQVIEEPHWYHEIFTRNAPIQQEMVTLPYIGAQGGNEYPIDGEHTHKTIKCG